MDNNYETSDSDDRLIWIDTGNYLLFTHRNSHCDDWPVIYNVAVTRCPTFKELSPIILSPRKENYYCHSCKDLHSLVEYTTFLEVSPGICCRCGNENLKWTIDNIFFVDFGIGWWKWQIRCGKCMFTSSINLTGMDGCIDGVNGEISPLRRIKYIIANTSIKKIITIPLDASQL